MPEPPVGYQQLKRKLKARLAELLEGNGTERHIRLDRESLTLQLRQALRTAPAELKLPALSPEYQEQIIRELAEEIVGVGPLELLMDDPEISEIMVNGPSEVFVERHGRLERTTAAFRDTEHLMSVIERLLDRAGVTVTESEPCADASLPDGSRLNVVLPPIALNGPTLTIRRKLKQLTVEDIIALGSVSAKAAQFLEVCVKAHVNMVIAGGTSTGKTTLVSILSKCIPSGERVVTIENVAELELLNREHWVRMVSRPPNADGRGEITLRTLVKNALRMRPDRIILGEARGGEALDIVQAMLTGHDGVLTVLHANSPASALERLETLMLMSGLELPLSICKQQVASAVELVVQLSRFPNGSRRIEQIVQVAGVSPEGFLIEPLFEINETVEGHKAAKGVLEATGTAPRFTKKFVRYNLEVSPELFQRAS